MRMRLRTIPALAFAAIGFACIGCSHIPGYPKPGPDVVRPDQILDFHTLYSENCSGCHGANGRNGAALPLNNAAYLAVAGEDNLRNVTAKGIDGTLMPPFARSSGGMLTDQQIDALVQGMIHAWGRPAEFAHVTLPPYASTTPGNAANGQKVFVTACARCHGAEGLGVKPVAAGTPLPQGASPDSIVDPAYLALVSDQSIRSLVIGGRPDENVPDWRGYLSGPGAHALTPQEIDDVVAWVISHRTPVAQPAQNIQDNMPNSTGPKTPGKEKQ